MLPSHARCMIAVPKGSEHAAALLQAIDPSSTVLIVGAGLSVPEYPLWEDLLAEMSLAMKIPSPDASMTLPRRFQALRDTDPGQYVDFLCKRFTGPPRHLHYCGHLLAQLGFAGHITTNFDPSFQELLRRTGRTLTFSVYPDILDLSEVRPDTLVYLHGQCDGAFQNDPERLVLHYAAYRRAYCADGAVAYRFFREVLSNRVCLFVGSALSDPPIQWMLQHLRDDNRPLRHAALLPAPSRPPREDNLLRDWNETIGLEAKQRSIQTGLRIGYFDRVDSQFQGLSALIDWWCCHRGAVPPAKRLAPLCVPEDVL